LTGRSLTAMNTRSDDGFLRRLAMIQEFAGRFEARYRRGERCTPVIRVTDLSPGCESLGSIGEAARTLLEGIEFRFHRE
jgi:hypothetical protein